MKVLVTGAKGQLGYDIVHQLGRKEIEYLNVDFSMLDLTDFKRTSSCIRSYYPNVVIHCAAFTNVDKAEIEIEKCRILNVDATANIAAVCNEIGAKLVYISSDYVFSGEGDVPYEIDSKTYPLSVYGKTKLGGEHAVIKGISDYFIVRTSWAFGEQGRNFVNTMLKLGQREESINVVADQIGSPTYTTDLAALIIQMIHTKKFGIYHATNEGYCSWAEFAVEIFKQAGLNVNVNPIKSEEYITKAIRPRNSRLSKRSLDEAGFQRLPDWKDALVRYMNKAGFLSN